MKKINLIIFDCDGVLVDSEPLSALAHKSVYAMQGVELLDEIMARCVGMKQKDITKLIASETGFDLPDEHIPLIWLKVKDLIQERLEPTPGIIDFLKADQRDRCVASSSALDRILLSLAKTGIDQYFKPNHVFNAAMVARGKPAPDLFLHAAAQCFAEPSHCAVFEDSIYGIQGAVAAGMTVFGYVGGSHCGPDHRGKLMQAGASAVFSSWAEAGAYLRAEK